MAFLTSFIESIKLPKKKSVFKLNRISMDIVVVYMFIFIDCRSPSGCAALSILSTFLVPVPR